MRFLRDLAPQPEVGGKLTQQSPLGTLHSAVNENEIRSHGQRRRPDRGKRFGCLGRARWNLYTCAAGGCGARHIVSSSHRALRQAQTATLWLECPPRRPPAFTRLSPRQ